MEEIKVISKNEIDKIVNLHMQSLKDGLLYRLGKDALKVFYQELFADKDSFIIAYCLNNKITGVAASSKDVEKVFDKIKKNNFFKLSYKIFAKSIKSPLLPFQLLFSKYSNSLKPELVFLFVDPAQRGKKIGEKLVKATSLQFKKNGVHQYKITILSSNSKGIKFYERMGFRRLGMYKYAGDSRDIYAIKI